MSHLRLMIRSTSSRSIPEEKRNRAVALFGLGHRFPTEAFAATTETKPSTLSLRRVRGATWSSRAVPGAPVGRPRLLSFSRCRVEKGEMRRFLRWQDSSHELGSILHARCNG